MERRSEISGGGGGGVKKLIKFSALLIAFLVVLLPAAEAGVGNIGDEIDFLEFDDYKGNTPDLIQVSGNVYAIFYSGSSQDGYLKTVTIGSDGNIGNTVLDSAEICPNQGLTPDLIHISGSVYAVAYSGLNGWGSLKTFTILDDGTVSPFNETQVWIDCLRFEGGNGVGREPSIIHISGSVYAIAHGNETEANKGYITTVEIASNGAISDAVLDKEVFAPYKCKTPDLIHISGDVYAVAYRGHNDLGSLKTVKILENGTVSPFNETQLWIDLLRFDTETGKGVYPEIIHISGNVYAIAYGGVDDDGFVKTVTIESDGSIGDAVLDSFEFAPNNGGTPDIIHISGDVYAIAYEGQTQQGSLKTITISDAGTLSETCLDLLRFDTTQGKTPSIIHISDSVYAVAYTGESDDGYLKTLEITSSDCLISCDSGGNEKNQFALGENVFVKGEGLAANTNYTIWIQLDPVSEGDAIVSAEDPSTTTPKNETVKTDAQGDFPATLIWSINASAPVTYHEYDIVADNLESGTVGTYNVASDDLDSASVAGIVAPVPDVSALVLFASGLVLVLVYFVWGRRKKTHLRPAFFSFSFFFSNNEGR